MKLSSRRSSVVIFLGILAGSILVGIPVRAKANNATDEQLGLHEGTIRAKAKNSTSSWGFHPAEKVESKLPNVLLIGDSILSGYFGTVAKQLEGAANIDYYKTPMHINSNVGERIEKEVLAKRSYDVIHFNLGLHGWPEDRVPEDRYKELMRTFVGHLRSGAPGATLIWASTTPLRIVGSREIDPQLNPIITGRNRKAAEVMGEEDITINDLHTLAVGNLEYAKLDRAHWSGPANVLMGWQVAEYVAKAIEGRSKEQ